MQPHCGLGFQGIEAGEVDQRWEFEHDDLQLGVELEATMLRLGSAPPGGGEDSLGSLAVIFQFTTAE